MLHLILKIRYAYPLTCTRDLADSSRIHSLTLSILSAQRMYTNPIRFDPIRYVTLYASGFYLKYVDRVSKDWRPRTYKLPDVSTYEDKNRVLYDAQYVICHVLTQTMVLL